jgi:hypothetical protein
MDDPQPFQPHDAALLPSRSCDFKLEKTIDNETRLVRLDAQLTLGTEFLNLMGRSVTITTRLNERYTLHPRFDRGPVWTPGLYITLTRKVSEEVKVQPPIKSDVDQAGVGPRMFHAMHEQQRSDSMQRNQRKTTTPLFVSLKELKGAGGRIYLEDLDVVVSLSECTTADIHPFTSDAISNYMELRWSDESSFMFRMYIVDNDRKLSSRYFNFNGRIFRIPVVYKAHVKDGVYIVHPPPVTSGLAATGSLKYDAQYLTLDEAETQYQLYASIAEAETYGFSKDGIARELANHKRLDERAQVFYKDEERQFAKEKWTVESATREEDRQWQREQWAFETQTAAEKAASDREAARRKEQAEDAKRRFDEKMRDLEIEGQRVKNSKEMIAVLATGTTTVLTLILAIVKLGKK